MPRSISESLLRWYEKNQRDLPWRGTTDPYAILVSEVMLQQTQVATVLPYYSRFMERFSTSAALAEASDEEALSAWEGLGYYRRLRNLKAAAKVISESGWPADLAELPGVGRYTASAVSSIAFGTQVACADGNVRRVMSRLVGRDLSLAEAERTSSDFMGRSNSGTWNQAVMELGALVCTPAAPRCCECPVHHGCAAKATGRQTEIPEKRPATVVDVHHAYACFVKDGHVALKVAADEEWWAGLYCFPRTDVALGESPQEAVSRIGLKSARHLGRLRHTVTKHRIRAEAFAGSGKIEGVEWRELSSLGALPMPAPQRRMARWLEATA